MLELNFCTMGLGLWQRFPFQTPLVPRPAHDPFHPGQRLAPAQNWGWVNCIQMSQVCTIFRDFLNVTLDMVFIATLVSPFSIVDILNVSRIPWGHGVISMIPSENYSIGLNTGPSFQVRQALCLYKQGKKCILRQILSYFNYLFWCGTFFTLAWISIKLPLMKRTLDTIANNFSTRCYISS